ncbi:MULTISPECIES: ABC transporter ATP-binding protein [Thermotoga]|jgi:peptide/nickel transport system ATP-binding protein|uniref:Oligopeptide/dipeptide ABC transporter, ATPase subunit n=2 Tax=Thermotoga petrophila TaxID=93929 RepID=D2C747_THEP2|nr:MULTISPECIES: ABC transporter ATP-binding protein [Thermotoga]KUK23610.1 MAG: Oligopeptide ABC transporter, ATP-binding protein [Thermotoga petrophila]KUK33954.1 MAG: Oligopeptide ABC transporter, ATP-binding protein [Thermotoga sp. 47_83]MDK2893364.1 peptide/nickel transport system ATP-binding protein [Thermotoga sp.]ACB09240.1 oligopeptide/dipeptide ABC transporter, ATPase subunit [Thermotoga sp. RQ2]ADA66783.1 oligopeptide/dipeptide ABC transporter, ATPase subunit [Thermotoga petrophila 
MEKVLEIRDLKVYFDLTEGTVKAVDGVSFDIRRGEILGLVGESGCGKSVTAQSILRILPKSARIVNGEIVFHRNGKTLDLTRLDPEGEEIRDIRGKDISMIFQEPMASFSPVYTVGAQMVEAILLHENISKEEARKRVVEMLKKVKIPNAEKVVDMYPFELSGGMLQRCMIAMAMSLNPTLLLADEPTTALDVTIQAQILYLMKELQKEYHSSILLITHDMGVVAQMADRVAVMYLGNIVETAEVFELFKNPLHPYTQALLRSIPKIGIRKTRLETIKGMVPDPYNLPTGCRFHNRCEKFMKGLCDVKEPPEVEVKPGHKVKCFLYGGEKE